MPKGQLRTSKTRAQSGFSPVEILLAATVFGFIVTALVGAIIYGRSSTADSGEHIRASELAEEGAEAARNIRDSGYSNLTDGTYGLLHSGNGWALAGSQDTTGIFNRALTISSADSTHKNITSTVNWSQGGQSYQTSIVTRLSNWFASIISNGPIIMAYSKTTTTPFYRTWNGTTWSAEGSAQAVVGNINYVVVKSSRTRNEAIMGVQTSTGAIYIQIWNGTTWGNLTQVGTGPTNTRSFDIAYEKTTGRAMITYSSGVDFAYRIWDGSTLSSATTVTTPPTTGNVNWIQTESKPTTGANEIAMIMLDSTSAVYGMVWTGTAWVNMGDGSIWDVNAASSTKKSVAVAYEQTTGRAIFLWGDAVATDQYYRIWTGSALAASTLLDIPAEGGVAEWTELVPRPNSNEIMYGVQDATINLNTRKWSGTAWDTATQHAEHDAAAENASSRNFDIVWETATANAGKAWLVWGDGATVSAKQWSGTAWGTATVLTGSDDTSFIKLRADPTSGAIFAGAYENSTSATMDITERHLTGGGSTWSTLNQIWTGPTGADPVFFRVDIATP